ncbi:MAG: glycosyltransferase [Alphaproteobacteria bacterium]
MRVLQAMAGAARGGAEAFFHRLVPALAEAGVSQRAVIRPHDGGAPGGLAAAGVPVTHLPFGGWLDWRTGSGLRGAIASFSPEIVLTWMSRATRFCPRGAFVHAARLGGYYDLKYYRRCDHLVVNTLGIRDWVLGQDWPEARVHYLPNFADESVVAPVDRAAEDTPADAPLILALGRLHPNKGFDVLLRALRHLPHARLWLAGDGPLRGGLVGLAEELGVGARVRFLGWRADVPALIAAADAIAVPSRHEPLGNVVLEAWARQKPVIAARSQGPEELIDQGRTGILVPVGDAAALAWALRDVLGAARTSADLAAAGHAVYEAHFSRDHVVRAYVEFFAQVCAGNGMEPCAASPA